MGSVGSEGKTSGSSSLEEQQVGEGGAAVKEGNLLKTYLKSLKECLEAAVEEEDLQDSNRRP